MKGRGSTFYYRLRLAGVLLFLAKGFALPAAGADSLDDYLSCLESNGILADRAAAVQSGLKGILQSIDPDAVICGEKTPGPMEEGAPTSVISALELWPENLAYLKVSGLEPDSGDEIVGHIESLSGRGGVLFDLRGARGEDLKSACVLAGLARRQNDPLFIVTDNCGRVLETNLVAKALARAPLLVVLIDRGTSGASEALASVMKGHSGVILIGAATKGDPSLRSLFSLPGGKRVWLATRKWRPVTGKPSKKMEVMPDVVVASGSGGGNDGFLRTNLTNRVLSTKSDSDKELMMRVAGDVVLQRATDILLGLQAIGEYGRN